MDLIDLWRRFGTETISSSHVREYYKICGSILLDRKLSREFKTKNKNMKFIFDLYYNDFQSKRDRRELNKNYWSFDELKSKGYDKLDDNTKIYALSILLKKEELTWNIFNETIKDCKNLVLNEDIKSFFEVLVKKTNFIQLLAMMSLNNWPFAVKKEIFLFKLKRCSLPEKTEIEYAIKFISDALKTQYFYHLQQISSEIDSKIIEAKKNIITNTNSCDENQTNNILSEIKNLIDVYISCGEKILDSQLDTNEKNDYDIKKYETDLEEYRKDLESIDDISILDKVWQVIKNLFSCIFSKEVSATEVFNNLESHVKLTRLNKLNRHVKSTLEKTKIDKPDGRTEH